MDHRATTGRNCPRQGRPRVDFRERQQRTRTTAGRLRVASPQTTSATKCAAAQHYSFQAGQPFRGASQWREGPRGRGETCKPLADLKKTSSFQVVKPKRVGFPEESDRWLKLRKVWKKAVRGSPRESPRPLQHAAIIIRFYLSYWLKRSRILVSTITGTLGTRPLL